MPKLRGIWKQYGSLPVMENFSLELAPGQIHCLFGPSGCGKTTLLHMLAGLVRPERGSVEELDRSKLSVVFQEDRLLPWLTVLDNIRFVLESLMGKQEAAALAMEELRQVGLGDFASAYPRQLSGGMRQRAALARALAPSPKLLLLDEPFKGLNLALKLGLLERLDHYQHRTGGTIILVTHDAEEALLLSDSVHLVAGPPLALQRSILIPEPRPERLRNPELMTGYRSMLQ